MRVEEKNLIFSEKNWTRFSDYLSQKPWISYFVGYFCS